MKLIKFFAVSLLMAALFTACSKDKKDIPAPPAFDIIGVWEGKIGSNNSIPTGYFGLDVKANGKIDRLSDGEVSGSGTWTLIDDVFKAEYTAKSTGVIVKISAKLDKIAHKFTNGTWKNSADNGGTWFATKK